ncbi:serine hydrolase domain-containing protein [Oceanobacillus picturae]|uniref:serine hydrolase domain-containing protein n=1 Tax=Oceanobacillus picturae TaxID=171693 RepID=UPI000E699356|nr:serine hydrolase domain-containing protein [Oceanobacillus picturae]RIU90151.1 class A beta-lactamase-related serine hydrolase [Oceanobacillus picturae]
MNITLNKGAFNDVTSFTEKTRRDMGASASALVIMKNNTIVHEWYSGKHHFEQGAKKVNLNSRFNVYSVRVTYVGLAIALAVYDGFLNVDDKISDYLNEYNKDILGDTTIRHLLTRCTGLRFENDNVYRAFDLGTNIEGKRPDLLAKILFKTTGKTVNEIISNRVFKPLNWSNSGWVTEGNNNLVCDIDLSKGYPALRVGSNIGDGRNLYISARELALWGNLHLNQGIFEGNQILSQEVFELATSIQSPNTLPQDLPRFGFLWWVKKREASVNYYELGSDLPGGSYQILGASGCSCTVIPKYNAVAVRMLNSLNAYEQLGFDYIKDIKMFGNLVISSLKKL